MIVFGSRPSFSHHWSSTWPRRFQSSGPMYAPFHPSAYFAAARSVRFSPRPPIQIGMRGCSGFGLFGALVTVKCVPWKFARRCSGSRSEEHTSELQSLAYLVCRLLLEKKKKQQLHITV